MSTADAFGATEYLLDRRIAAGDADVALTGVAGQVTVDRSDAA